MLTRFTAASESYRYARIADLPAITTMLCDERVGRWLWFTPAPASMFASFFRPMIDGQWEDLALGELPTRAIFVVEDHEGRYLGQGASIAVEGSPGGYEIGFQLCAEAWGRGVGSRLAWFLTAWTAHAGHAPYRIEAACLEGNLGSQKVITGLGLQPEGRRPGYRLKQEVRHTELLFGAPLSELDHERLAAVAAECGIST